MYKFRELQAAAALFALCGFIIIFSAHDPSKPLTVMQTTGNYMVVSGLAFLIGVNLKPEIRASYRSIRRHLRKVFSKRNFRRLSKMISR